MPEPEREIVAGDAALQEIATQWSLLRMAHDGAFAESEAARRALLLRYAAAVRRYVAALLRDSHMADEVAHRK